MSSWTCHKGLDWWAQNIPTVLYFAHFSSNLHLPTTPSLTSWAAWSLPVNFCFFWLFMFNISISPIYLYSFIPQKPGKEQTDIQVSLFEEGAVLLYPLYQCIKHFNIPSLAWCREREGTKWLFNVCTYLFIDWLICLFLYHRKLFFLVFFILSHWEMVKPCTVQHFS